MESEGEQINIVRGLRTKVR